MYTKFVRKGLINNLIYAHYFDGGLFSAAKLVLFIRLLVLLRLFEKIWSYFGLIFEDLVLFLHFCPLQFLYIQNHHYVLLNDNSNKYSMLCMQIRCITGPKHSYEYIWT